MKVYRSNSDKPRKKLNKKAIISIGLSIALVATALAITLTLTMQKPPIDEDPGDQTGGKVQVAYVMPVDAYEVGLEFSNEKLVQYKPSGIYQTHEAVDFLVGKDAEVKAIFDGTILSIDVGTTMEGTVIKIQHAEGIVSVYKGLAEDVEVSVNDTVEAGDVLGRVGVMPREAAQYEQAHLHLEVLKDGVLVNPMDYLPEMGDK